MVAPLLTLATALAPARGAAQTGDTTHLAEIQVVGTREALAHIPGSAFLLDRATLRAWHPASVNEALRRVPGVVARDEEGFGLRPNIGIRGLNPTRSAKVLLLEDGLPITVAPYGANESYYHPPLARFDRVEVLKGSGQIGFGPQTIGGVINYMTPAVPRDPTLTLSLSRGTRAFLAARVRAGASLGRAGLLASYDRQQGDGARDNVGTRLDDLSLKGTLALGARQALTVRGNAYRERSDVTYSGLTEAEWAAAPRQNAFSNDSMLLDRWGASATHRWTPSTGIALTTSLYAYEVSRDWWRQSSNSAERPNDASDPNCGGMANLHTTCGNQGRVRDYYVWGFEPRLRAVAAVLGVPTIIESGLRVHGERQDRRQLNGASPAARQAGPATDVNSGLREDNLRENRAYAAFAQSRLFLGVWTLTPGVRVEHVTYHRTNRLANPDTSGRATLTAVVPGLGATFGPGRAVTLFAGVHRGFAPPRTEDVITNAGGVIDLDAELSWNYEVGVRVEGGAARLEVTAFRLDFQNQTVPASVAGGAGATLTSAGRTLHQGLELAARLDAGRLVATPHNVFVEGALTWLPTARFDGPRFVYVGTAGPDVPGKVYAGPDAAGTRQQESVTGNRLPYAPRGTLALTLGYAFRNAFDVRLEAVAVSRQYGDALNTSVVVPDGQQGPIAGYMLWNAAATYTHAGITLFVTARNLTDRLYVADRTRGLLPGLPRTVQAGVTQAF
jgi:Fe(3+) dicitrate transport protein